MTRNRAKTSEKELELTGAARDNYPCPEISHVDNHSESGPSSAASMSNDLSRDNCGGGPVALGESGMATIQNQGWVKLWRQIEESAVFADPNLLKLFLLCLVRANHKETWWTVHGLAEPVRLLPGQFITGRFALHSAFYPRRKKTNASPSTVWRWLQTLQHMGNLHIKTNSRFSRVTVCQWEHYQSRLPESEQPVEQPVNSQRTADEQPVHTDKNVKTVKNEEKIPVNQPDSQVIAKNNDAYVAAFVAAYDQYFPEPYEWQKADFIQLAAWKKSHGGVPPERFAELARVQWDRGRYAQSCSLTIRGVATSWSKLAASAAQLVRKGRDAQEAAPDEDHAKGWGHDVEL